MDEPTLIGRCQRGDKEAFRRVVENYRQMVFTLAFRMLCDESAAKDIVQETFIRAWLNIGRYDTGRSLRTWIYTIAVRLCYDTLEKESHTAALPHAALLQNCISDQTPDRSLENQEMAALIEALALRLSPKQRVVFTLAYLECCDTQEIASLTGLNAHQIKSNLCQARKKIKEQLKRLGYE